MRKIFLLSLLSIFILVVLSINVLGQIQSLPDPVKQYSCVSLPQTYFNSTFQNISIIKLPDNDTYIAINARMTNLGGGYYNYTFCNTTQLGQYIVNGFGDLDGVITTWQYDFLVNGSGQNVNQSQITLIIIGIVVMLIVVAFFFILGVMFKHPGTKIFFMALSTISLVVIIGIIASNAAVYLAEFPGLVSIYDKYYIFVISLSAAAMAGLILWLIYYSVTLFNKTRGRINDDD